MFIAVLVLAITKCIKFKDSRTNNFILVKLIVRNEGEPYVKYKICHNGIPMRLANDSSNVNKKIIVRRWQYRMRSFLLRISNPRNNLIMIYGNAH